MLTLRMLKKCVELPEGFMGEPSCRQLQESGVPIFIQKEMDDPYASLTVYMNGYVVYRVGKRFTVFPINYERGYSYYPILETTLQSKVAQDFFEDEEWYLLPLLIGESRLQHNLIEKEYEWSLSMTDCLSGQHWLAMKRETDMEERVLQKIEVEELLTSLTEKQRQAIHLKFWEGESQPEIAEHMGIKHRQSVSNMLQRALKTLQEQNENIE